MPTIIVKTKIIIPLLDIEIDVKAGPGHRPPKPHPTPNIPAPSIKRMSKSFALGI